MRAQKRVRSGVVLAALAFTAATAGAQEAARTADEPLALTLEEALALARQNNPGYLATRNDEGPAVWSVREALGDFLPHAALDGGIDYQEPGSARIGNFTAEQLGLSASPSYYFSGYTGQITMQLSGRTFFNLAQQRANRRAVTASVVAAEIQLDADVTQAYVAVLRARDNVELWEQQLESTEENLRLASARTEAGVGIPLEVKQATVERGRALVNLLTARSQYETAQLRLLQLLGIDIEVEDEVVLTTELPVFEPPWSRETLVDLAMQQHPTLRSLDAAADAQQAAARTAWSSYLPTLSASALFRGFTRMVGNDEVLVRQGIRGLESRLEDCQDFNDLNSRLADPYPMRDCSGYVLTDFRADSIRSAAVSANAGFPFGFEREPMVLSFGVSLPIFQGFTRQRQIAEAHAAAEDTEHQLRAARLRLQADVAAAYLALETAYEAVQIEETNHVVAGEQLEQARERFRVGLDNFIDLTDAETLKSQADQAYLAAIYTFHEALANLEAAVGQSLRPTN